jgi:hypothetical protein
MQYLWAQSALRLYDHWLSTTSFRCPVGKQLAAEAERRGVPVGEWVFYYPRGGYDLWGVEFFLLPRFVHPGIESRAVLSFLLPPVRPIASSRAEADDYQLLANDAAFPRAWVVHQVRLIEPIQGLRWQQHWPIIASSIYRADPIWQDSQVAAIRLDARHEVWLEAPREQWPRISSYLRRHQCSCTVAVTSYEPDRVELSAELEVPGIIVLAEPYYPGWVAEVDGQRSRVYVADRLMRAVLVPAGQHKISFRYRPLSVLAGRLISVSAMAALCLCLVLSVARRVKGHRQARRRR